jgi:hypothetical protein
MQILNSARVEFEFRVAKNPKINPVLGLQPNRIRYRE